MTRRLPARPNLEHLRTQAKALLAKLREGDAEAARILSQYLPEATKLSPEEVRARGFRLADAQAAVARKAGFANWPGLARHVDQLRRMEGTWGFRSLEVDASAMPASMLTNSSLLIDGDRFRMESPEGPYEGVFTIDVEHSPHLIDIDFVEGPEAGNRCQGIFELDGDRFLLCLGLAGSSRPKRFATAPGSGHALEELVRKDRARPPAVNGGTPAVEASPAVSSVGAAGDFEAVLTPTHQKLQGEWLPLELITSGTPLQPAWLPFGLRTHSGVETKVVFGGQTQVHAKVRFNESTSPIEVDYYNLAGKKGTLSLGLFRWDGDEAVYCMAPPGAPRPADFGCPAGSGRILSRWKRKS